MTLPVSREKAIEIIHRYHPQESDINHYLETEVIMKKFAERFGEDKEYWGMLGLLHDVDWALTKENPSEHLKKTSEILKEDGFDDRFIEIIKSHGYGHEILPELKHKKRNEKVGHALASAETVTGLIYAYALMRDKRISDMEVKGLKKKFKDKTFAGNCNREIIREIERTGLSLDEFFELAINSISGIKGSVGLE